MFRRLRITPPTYRMMNAIINHRQIHRIRLGPRLRRHRQRTPTPAPWHRGQILHVVVLRTRHPNRKRERLVPPPRPAVRPRPDRTGTAIARFGTGATAHPRGAAAARSLPATAILTGAAAVLLLFVGGAVSVGIVVVFDLDDDEGVPYAPLGVETNVVYHVLVPLFGGFGERRTDGVYRPPQQFQIGFDGGGGSVLAAIASAAAVHAGSAGISIPGFDGGRTSRQRHFVGTECSGGGRAEGGEEGTAG
mmetsp:Transcript_31568/g.66102  ORF Transcript_31568/g.66102 Transcript_31568/m.66102 type:complete len:248 (-) Transcript_31568:120-863(-)